ncbi:MAG: hypothetical protein FH758_09330 [Firmicutes bacterium]|nr:hypothetical protein [Bacillota bacterium]
MSGKWQKILKLSVHGGFLDGQEYEFSPHLNCLVGGRGSGKTTVVELLRFALDCLPKDAMLKRRSEHHVQAVLGGGFVTVMVQTAGGSVYKIKRQVGYKPQVSDVKGKQTKLYLHGDINFPLVVFGQSELERVADDAATRLAVLDGMISELQLNNKVIRSLRQNLQNIRPEAAALQQDINQLKRQTELIPIVKERLQELETYDLDGLMVRQQQREQERYWIKELCREARKKERQLQQRTVEYTVNPNDYESWNNADLIEESLSKYAETVEKQKYNFGLLAREWENTYLHLEELQDSLTNRHRQIEEQERPAMSKFYGHNLVKAMEERSEYVQTLLDLEQKQHQLQEKQRRMKTIIRRRNELLTEMEKMEYELFRKRRDASNRASGLMGNNLQVTVSHKEDTGQYREFLAQALINSGFHYNRLAEVISTTIPPKVLAYEIRNEQIMLLADATGLEKERAERIFNYLVYKLTPEQLLELEEMPVPDWVEVELLDGHTWKPSDQLSKGQRCTAILPLLLLDSVQPLIIDQPEDHLDNAYICRTVVPALHQVKKGRQIILATHNANIPVLGKAEENIVLNSDGRQGWVAASGGLDRLQVLELLELLLEGGPGALQDRLQIYHPGGWNNAKSS